MKRGKPSKNQLEKWSEDCEKWNKDCPVGTKVILTDDLGQQHETFTRTPAWLLGHGYPVVSVVGRSGGYDLYRLRRVE